MQVWYRKIFTTRIVEELIFNSFFFAFSFVDCIKFQISDFWGFPFSNNYTFYNFLSSGFSIFVIIGIEFRISDFLGFWFSDFYELNKIRLIFSLQFLSSEPLFSCVFDYLIFRILDSMKNDYFRKIIFFRKNS